MRIAIVEDEPIAIERLEHAVLRCAPDAVVVGRLQSVRDTITWIENNTPPDLLFLDIRLSDGLSLDIFKTCTVSCPVIFTTAHDEYVMDAFAANGIEYLLKPIEASRLRQAIEKYRQLKSHFQQRLTTPPSALMEKASPIANTSRTRYIVRRGAEFLSIPLRNVAYFCSEHKLTFLVDRDGQRYLIDDPLAGVESQVDANDFFRASRQYLISIDAIVRFRPGGKGQVFVELSQPAGHIITVSQERAADFRRWLDR